jgi:hypothetical protein
MSLGGMQGRYIPDVARMVYSAWWARYIPEVARLEYISDVARMVCTRSDDAYLHHRVNIHPLNVRPIIGGAMTSQKTKPGGRWEICSGYFGIAWTRFVFISGTHLVGLVPILNPRILIIKLNELPYFRWNGSVYFYNLNM